MKTLGLIDADILVYKVTTVCEVEIDWGEDIWTLHSDFREARQAADDWIEAIAQELKLDAIILAFSDTKYNFRKDIYPAYKSNRKDRRKPVVFRPLREYLQTTYESFERPGLEGDDVLGILGTARGVPAVKGFDKRIIITVDKDLQGVPGLLYNSNKPEQGVIEISPAAARYWHMLQTLTGDITDGYPGCPGIGPKRAEECLAYADGDARNLWPAVVQAYKKAGLTETDALIQARVAKILTAEDYNFKKREPILWTP